MLAENYAGQKLGLNGSIDRIIADMEMTLDELANGEYNGTKIKDSQQGQIPEYYQLALKPVLAASETLFKTMNANGGWQAVPIDHESRERFSDGKKVTTEANLNEIDERLTGAVNNWLETVHARGLWDKVGLPLAINSTLRRTPGEINQMGDVMHLTDDGWKAISFIPNTEAAERNQRADAELAEARRASGADPRPQV
jgi:hypothetical protein